MLIDEVADALRKRRDELMQDISTVKEHLNEMEAECSDNEVMLKTYEGTNAAKQNVKPVKPTDRGKF